MKWLLTALLVSGLALAQTPEPENPTPTPPPAEGEPANNTGEPTAPADTPPAETTDPATNPAANPATPPAGGPAPATPTDPAKAPETPVPSVPVVKIQVTVPEALRNEFTEALKVFSHERVPLEPEYVASGDVQFLTSTDIPFNPDAGSRTLTSGNQKRIWINTSTTLPRSLVFRVEAAKVLKLPDPVLLPKERNLTEQDRQALKTQFASKGDLNGDDRIDLLDLIILAQNMDLENPQKGDLNQDGQVNEQDYNLFQQLYGK